MSSWNLPFNNGWNMTSWILREALRINRRKFFLVEVVLTGKYWNRVKLAQKNFAASDRSKEFSVILPQVLLSESTLKKLHRQLSNWLKTPIEKFSSESLALKEELAGLNAQSFAMEFGKRDDLITNIGHTACTISYKTNSLIGESSYVVDQSCIQTFVDGLSNYFSAEA
jgi:hypothetical protein